MGIDIRDLYEGVEGDMVAYADESISAASGWPTSEGADGGVAGDGREAWGACWVALVEETLGLALACLPHVVWAALPSPRSEPDRPPHAQTPSPPSSARNTLSWPLAAQSLGIEPMMPKETGGTVRQAWPEQASNA